MPRQKSPALAPSLAMSLDERRRQWQQQPPQPEQRRRQVQGKPEELLLPPGWQTAVSRSTGETYYVNVSRQVTTYERPASDAPARDVMGDRAVGDTSGPARAQAQPPPPAPPAPAITVSERLGRDLELTSTIPPCLPASLPPCLPASLPPCPPASALCSYPLLQPERDHSGVAAGPHCLTTWPHEY